MRSALLLLVLVGGGVWVFWKSVGHFRAAAKERQEAAKEKNEAEKTAEGTLPAGIPLADTAQIYSAYDGQATGRMNRTFTGDTATIEVLVFLPALDVTQASYEMWMLKDGLADVVDVGELILRGDGSWAATFVAGPATGIVDPHLFSTLVIMQEPRDGNPSPSGYKIAQGSWEE